MNILRDRAVSYTHLILLKEQINELVSNGLASVNISIDTLDERRDVYKRQV